MTSLTSVSAWLQLIHLDQYLATLEDAGFTTLSACAAITDADLVRMGITLPGHRKRIIARLPKDGVLADEVSARATDSDGRRLVPPDHDWPPGGAEGTRDDVYDVPPFARNSVATAAAAEEQGEYMNIAAVLESRPHPPPPSDLPSLPPKTRASHHQQEVVDEKLGMTQAKKAATPVPAPRTSCLKPVPKPRGSIRPTPAPRREKKPSSTSNLVKLAGVTTSETSLEVDPEEASDLARSQSSSVSSELNQLNVSQDSLGAPATPSGNPSPCSLSKEDLDELERMSSSSSSAVGAPTSDRPSAGVPPKGSDSPKPCLSVLPTIPRSPVAGHAAGSPMAAAMQAAGSPMPLAMHATDLPPPRAKMDSSSDPFLRLQSFDKGEEIPKTLDEWEQSIALDKDLPPSASVETPGVFEDLFYFDACEVKATQLSPAAAGCGAPVAEGPKEELDDNMVNEMLYEAEKCKHPVVKADPESEATYEPIWNLRSGPQGTQRPVDDASKRATLFNEPPPSFPPPPLPVGAAASTPAKPPRRGPNEHVAPAPAVRQRQGGTKPAPAALDNRDSVFTDFALDRVGTSVQGPGPLDRGPRARGRGDLPRVPPLSPVPQSPVPRSPLTFSPTPQSPLSPVPQTPLPQLPIRGERHFSEDSVSSVASHDAYGGPPTPPSPRVGQPTPPIPRVGMPLPLPRTNLAAEQIAEETMEDDPKACDSIYMNREEAGSTEGLNGNHGAPWQQQSAPLTEHILLKGFLHKTGSNVKGDFLKRWCVLESNNLSYFETEKSAAAKNTILHCEMLSVHLASDERFECTYELGTTKHYGRSYLFAAANRDERQRWVISLAKSIAQLPSECSAKIQDLDRGGVIFIREGATTEWRTCWIHLKSRTLHYYNVDLQDFEEIDMRKITSIKKLPLSKDGCPFASEEGHVFVLSLQDTRALYMQGVIRKETDAWFTALHYAATASGHDLGDQQLSKDNVPVLVDKCINFISIYGMKTEGIYRLSGQHSKVSNLLTDFNNDARDVHLRQDVNSVHDVTNALKRFFRQLSDPLFTFQLHAEWIRTSNVSEVPIRVQQYKNLMGQLPLVNYQTARAVITHLARVAELDASNKMSTVNLASVFGPVLVDKVQEEGAESQGFATTNAAIAVMKDLLDNQKTIFELKGNEFDQQQKMEEALRRLELLSSGKGGTGAADQFILAVYIHSRVGQSVTLKVTSAMTAEDLRATMCARAELDKSKQWSVFEIICKEELERPVHYSEKIVDVTLRWGQWPEEFRRDNFLCVKENTIYHKVDLVFDPQFSLFSEMRFSEKKGFKKYCFDFSQMKLSYQKDTKAVNPCASWNAEDLLVYMGIQQKRNPPTKWGFTFISVTDHKISGPFFGHSVCCNNTEEFYRWLAAILHAQHPEGLVPRDGHRATPTADLASLRIQDADDTPPSGTPPSHASSAENLDQPEQKSLRAKPSFMQRLKFNKK